MAGSQTFEICLMPRCLFLQMTRLQTCSQCKAKKVIITATCTCCHNKKWCIKCVQACSDTPLSLKRKLHHYIVYSLST